MAADYDDGCGASWNNLPSVILVEVFSYLDHEGRVRASSTCRHWRQTLFHRKFWPSVHFEVRSGDEASVARTRFLAGCFASKLRDATLSFDSMHPSCVREASGVLAEVARNDGLRGLRLRPSHCRLRCLSKQELATFIDRVKALVRGSRRLESLSLGCSEDLTDHAGEILELLGRHQAHSLRQLGLASVKDDPELYPLDDLRPELFKPFYKLTVLSLDYDYTCDPLLYVLRDVECLRSLCVHVHGLEETHPGTSDAAWADLVDYNPFCQLQVVLVHAYDAVEVLHSHLLRRSMPLTHLKAFFCEKLNFRALQLLSTWYASTLQSVWWVDSFGEGAARHRLVEPAVDYVTRPDPLVMVAWRCEALTEIVLLGYKYFDEDLVAIARLRGDGLRRLDFASRDILRVSALGPALTTEISHHLGRSWSPLNDDLLPDVVHDPVAGDSDEVILPWLQQ